MTSVRSNVFFPSGHWSSNIGNAFFNLGTQYLLRECGHTVTHYDLPPFKSFGTAAYSNVSDFHYHVDTGSAWLVLDGPMFDRNFGQLFGPYLANAKAAGLRIALLSTGMIEYNDAERDHCLSVMEKYRPDVITTRDSQTFDVFRSAAPRVFNGICHAWFSPEAFPGFETTQHVVSAFDHAPEPRLRSASDQIRSIIDGSGDGVSLTVKHSTFTKVSRLLQRDFASEVAGLPVVRPCHQVLARGNWRLFFKPQTLCAQTPYVYLNVYRNSAVTLTDRLHASVATLAYGRPAILFNKSNRCYLLERLGVSHEKGKAMTIDLARLHAEKLAYVDWLRGALCV